MLLAVLAVMPLSEKSNGLFAAAADVTYHATGNSFAEPVEFEQRRISFGDPPTSAYLLVVSDGSGPGLPADDALSIDGVALRWPDSVVENGTRFGPVLRGVSLFDVNEVGLNFAADEKTTITFYLRVHNVSSQGLLFAVIENVWQSNVTHPIADDLLAQFESSNFSCGCLGVYSALYLNGRGELEFASSAGERSTTLKGTPRLRDGAWHHVAISMEKSNQWIQLFVDGETSYDSDKWFRCLDGTPTPTPDEVSDSVLKRFSSAPEIVMISGGAAIFGYGFAPAAGISLALLQVHARILSTAELAALSGNPANLSITPTAGFCIGAAMLLMGICTAALIAFLTWEEVHAGAPEAEVKAEQTSSLMAVGTLTTSTTMVNLQPDDEPQSKKMGVMEALAEGGGMAGQVGGSLGKALSVTGLLSILGGSGDGGKIEVGMMQKLAAIVPMALVPLQGLNLFISGWEWPEEFVAAVRWLSIPVSIDLPFILPTIPPYIWLLLKLALGVALAVFVVRFVAFEDAKAFDESTRQHKVKQRLRSESLRIMICEAIELQPDDPFAAELSRLISAAGKSEWEVSELLRIGDLRKRDAATLAEHFRSLPLPENVFEAALQHFAVTEWPAGRISDQDIHIPQERVAFISASRNIASALVGTGRKLHAHTVVELVGGMPLNSGEQTRLAKWLLVAGSLLLWENASADSTYEKISSDDRALGLDDPVQKKIVIGPSPNAATKTIAVQHIVGCDTKPANKQDQKSKERFSFEVGANCLTVKRLDCSSGWNQQLEVMCTLRGAPSEGVSRESLDFVHAKLKELCNTCGTELPSSYPDQERVFRTEAVSSLSSTVALAPNSVAPRPNYCVELRSDSTGAVLQVCKGKAFEALLRAVSVVCKFRSLDESFAVPAIEVRSIGAESIDVLKCCRVRVLRSKGQTGKIEASVAEPAHLNGTYTVTVQIIGKVKCPEHGQWLVSASTEHFAVRTTEPVPKMPYNCVHRASDSFKVSESIRNNELIRPCVQDVLYVCPEPTCCYTVCGQCARLNFTESIRIAVATALNGLKTPDLYRLLLLVLLALLFPITKDAVMVLACHPTLRCKFGISDGTSCYRGASASFIFSAFLAVFSLFVFRFGLVGWLYFTMTKRKRVVDSAVRSQWKGSQHPEWLQFLKTDSSVLSVLYSKYELKYFVMEQPWLLVVQVAESLAVAFMNPNSLTQLVAVSVVELGSLVYLTVTDPFIDVWHDLLAKVAAMHQVLQLSLMFFHRALEVESESGSSRKIVYAMLATGIAYLAFFVFVLWKRVVVPFRNSKRIDDAEALLREQRLILAMHDKEQSVPLMAELVEKFAENFGYDHLLTAIAAAHVFALSVPDSTHRKSSRKVCIDALQKIYLSQPVGIAWRPIDEIDGDARSHLGTVLRDLELSPEKSDERSFLDLSKNFAEIVQKCREQNDCGFAAGNVLTILTSSGTKLKDWDFAKVHILGANASDTVIEGGTFAGSTIRNSSFRGTVSIGVDYCAQLRNVEFGQTKRKDVGPRLLMKGHAAGVLSTAFSPDGTCIASASADTTVRVWDAFSGVQRTELKGHTKEVNCVSFSPEGDCIVSASADLTVCLWSTLSYNRISELKGHSRAVLCACFSPNGMIVVSGAADATARLWGVQTQSVTVLKGHKGPVCCASFSPCGNRVVTGSLDCSIRLWDTSTGITFAELCGHLRPVNSVVYSPDGTTILSGSADATMRIWSAATGALQMTVPEAKELVCLFSSDGGRIAIACYDKTVNLLDAVTHKKTAVLRSHEREVVSAAFSPDNSCIVSASLDSTLLLWDTSQTQMAKELKRQAAWIHSVAFSPDGSRVVCASQDSTVVIRDAKTGQFIRELVGHTSREHVWDAAYSPDGKVIASCGGFRDMTVRLWDGDSGDTIGVLTGHTSSVSKVAFSKSGKLLASGSADHTVKLWDMTTRQEVRVLRDHTSDVKCIAFSPDECYFASGSHITVCVYHAQTWQLLHSIKAHSNAVVALVFTPDSKRIITASNDKTIRQWDAESGQRIAGDFTVSDQKIFTNLAISPNGKYLASTGYDWDHFVHLIDLEKREQVTKFRHGGWTSAAAFSPDSKTLLSGAADATVHLWGIAGEMSADPPIEKKGVFCSCLRANGLSEVTYCLWEDLQALRQEPGNKLWGCNAPLFFVDCKREDDSASAEKNSAKPG